jgi:hypothetical protein
MGGDVVCGGDGCDDGGATARPIQPTRHTCCAGLTILGVFSATSNIVYAYTGHWMYFELMDEMRTPEVRHFFTVTSAPASIQRTQRARARISWDIAHGTVHTNGVVADCVAVTVGTGIPANVLHERAADGDDLLDCRLHRWVRMADCALRGAARVEATSSIRLLGSVPVLHDRECLCVGDQWRDRVREEQGTGSRSVSGEHVASPVTRMRGYGGSCCCDCVYFGTERLLLLWRLCAR